MTIDDLLVHLDDPKVQDKIKSILMDNATLENSPSKDDVLELEQNNKGLEIKNSRLEDCISNKDAEILELEQNNKALKSTNETLEESISNLEDRISVKDTELSSLEQKNEVFKSENETLKERVSSVEVCISNKESELSALEQKNEVFENHNEDMIKWLKALILGKYTEISDSSPEIVQLKNKLSELEAKIDDKKNELKLALKKEEDTKEKLNKSDKKLDWYREQFSEDVKIQDIYNDLSDISKGSLGGIFKSTTASGLVACGIQEKNIGNLWEYAKNEVVSDKNPDIKNIIDLFNILFSRFTLAFPMYEVQNVASGDEFDTQLHIKHNSSQNMSGTIELVLLRGYLNTKTDKVIKQSIVRI